MIGPGARAISFGDRVRGIRGCVRRCGRRADADTGAPQQIGIRAAARGNARAGRYGNAGGFRSQRLFAILVFAGCQDHSAEPRDRF